MAIPGDAHLVAKHNRKPPGPWTLFHRDFGWWNIIAFFGLLAAIAIVCLWISLALIIFGGYDLYQSVPGKIGDIAASYGFLFSGIYLIGYYIMRWDLKRRRRWRFEKRGSTQ